MRLAKRMAHLGFCSRREADDYILKGWVKVNGQVTREKGMQVTESDQITLNNQAQQQQSNRVTILLNKPVGYVSAQPEKGYKAAMELITAANQWSEDKSNIRFREQHRYGLAPAGRLDIDSVGLLVLTQDGRVAKQLIGETSSTEKEYLVRVTGRLSENGLKLLRITAYNVLGQVVYNRSAENSERHRMVTTGIAPGMYTLKIETDKGIAIRKIEILK